MFVSWQNKTFTRLNLLFGLEAIIFSKKLCMFIKTDGVSLSGAFVNFSYYVSTDLLHILNFFQHVILRCIAKILSNSLVPTRTIQALSLILNFCESSYINASFCNTSGL